MQGCETMEVFDAMERIGAIIAQTSTSDELLSEVLLALLDIFSCDRAWILDPGSPRGEHITVHMEQTRPEYPGVLATQAKVPSNPGLQAFVVEVLASSKPVEFQTDNSCNEGLNAVQRHFSVQSQMVMRLHPKRQAPWILGIHHCAKRVHYDEATRLFGTIAHLVGHGLAALIATSDLRESEERFRTLVERAPEAIVIFDCENLLFADANPNAEALFGLPLEALLKTGPMQLSPEFQSSGVPSAQGAAAYIQAALEGEFPIFAWEHANADGRVIPCEVRLALLPHPTRKLVRGSITDISSRVREEEERRELEARLAQSQKMEAIGNLTGGIAHDFNNLLTVILGNLDLLSMNPGNAEFVAEQVSQIRAASERATSLTHRLLAFARRQPLQPTNVNTEELLVGMGDLLRRTLGETIEVEIRATGTLWHCEVDAAQLEGALLNLAINARDAMPHGGRLVIEASNAYEIPEEESEGLEGEGGSFVMISVSDNGEGMTKEVLAQVFSPFFTTKEVGKGSGLGLSMVYGFVRQSGGHVHASSTVGRGTVMKLYLPRAQGEAPTASPSVPPIAEAAGHGERILVVEDEEGVRKTTCALLRTLGYRTCEAPTAVDALDMLDDHADIDLLLTDVVLAGGMDGSELARIARSSRPDLHILFMSGYSENAITRDGRLAPGVRLLKKPFSKLELSRQVHEALS